MYEIQNGLNQKEKVKRHQKYFLLLRKAAYFGSPIAQFEYALQFENINYLSLNNSNYNPKRSVYWYKKACAGNVASACNNLAHKFETGEGCKKNLKKALSLYKKSARLGLRIGEKNYEIMLSDISKEGRYSK